MNNKVEIICGEFFHAAFTAPNKMIPSEPGQAQKTLISLGFELKRCFQNASDRKVEIWEKKGGENEKVNSTNTNS